MKLLAFALLSTGLGASIDKASRGFGYTFCMASFCIATGFYVCVLEALKAVFRISQALRFVEVLF